MRVGVSSYAFARAVAVGEMTVDRLLDWATTRGIDAIQYCENLPWTPDRAVPEGVMIETGCRGIGPHLLDHLRFAQASGCGFVRLVIDDGDDEPSLDEAIERLRPFAEVFSAAGVVLAVENHDRFSAREMLQIVEPLGLGVVLDTSNSLGSLEGLETVVREIGPHVVNLHAKDVRAVRKPDMLGFDIVGTELGKGGIDWARLISQLPKLQSVTLEQWVPAGPDAISIEAAWADAGVERLRQILEEDNDRLVLGEKRRPAPIALRCGELTAEFEPDSGWLRDIRFGGCEMIRAVYAAFRRGDWSTPAATLSELEVEANDDGFRVAFRAQVEGFEWRSAIACSPRALEVHFEGQASAEVETNRVGLCLLHPPRFAGLPCRVVHPDGTATSAAFPDSIAPHQPFFAVAGLDALGVLVEFTGETFETEDQRNWTDASFKTYSRPLAWPRPYLVREGEEVRQAITMRFSEATPDEEVPATFPVPLPAIGAVAGAASGLAHVALPDGDSMRLVDSDGKTLFRPDAFSPTNFTEMNRNRPDGAVDVMFAMNPQVHAFDWRTIMESVEAQAECVATARQFATRVHAGPINLTSAGHDPRADSLRAAGWVLASVASLANAGAASVTYGLDLAPGPARHVLSDLADFAGEEVIVRAEAGGVTIEAAVAGRATRLYANLTSALQTMDVPAGARFRILDAASVRRGTECPGGWREADGLPISIAPYAYVRIDFEEVR